MCKLLIAVFAMLTCAAPYARAQAPCTPVMLCPYVGGGTGGAGGRAGVSGAGVGGTGGRSGTGGVGGRAGGSGAGGTGGGLVVQAALELEQRFVRPGGVLNASVTYANHGSAQLTVRELRIAARGPGATHAGGPYTDLAPVATNVVLQPGGYVTLQASRTFTAADPLGEWEAYSTHQDAAGVWHDAPSESFGLIGQQGPTPPQPGAGMTVGAQEWFIAPWAGTQIYKSNVNWATAYASGADIWNPEFIADLAGFVVFRHMDTNAVNWSKISKWSQRKLPTDPGNQEVYIDGASPSSTTGMAVEWQIDLCNRANVDCWFTHPYLADNDYVSQQATLIKAKLSPALRAYIELSNEVWNGSFSAFQQAIDAGKAQGVPGSNQYYQGIAHEMKRALEIFQLYEGVFGGSAMGTRVIRVFSQSGNLDLTTQALRNVYDSAQWNPNGQRIDLLALAPYIGNGTSGAAETLSRWKSEVDSKVAGEPIATAKSQASSHDIPMVGCYEAGMHHLQSADVWARNPDAYDAYVYMLDRFATKMNGPCALYTLHGTWEAKGAWGLYNAVGQDVAQAPKARGTAQWIAGTATRAGDRTRFICTVVVVWFVIMLIGIALITWRRKLAKQQQDHDRGE